MKISILLTHFMFALVLGLLSWGITWWMLHRVAIMDMPNERSSHDMPVPRGGGVSIVATFLVGVIFIFVFADAHIDQRFFWGFLISTVAIAVVSFYDDIKNYSAKIKLTTHFVAILLVLAAGNVLHELELPHLNLMHDFSVLALSKMDFGKMELGWVGYALTFIWLLGMSNAYNFMDGIDGLAASTAVIVCAFFGWITFHQGSHFVYIVSYTILAGAAGFLYWNRPPARIFMGDVGSVFLGFVLACLAIIAARYDMSQTSFLVMPLLLFHFIFDTAFTMCRRGMAGENIMQAHRTHLYQLLVRMGNSHASVTGMYCLLGVAQGFTAIWMVHMDSDMMILVFVPFTVIYTLFAYAIIVRAKKHGIICKDGQVNRE